MPARAALLSQNPPRSECAPLYASLSSSLASVASYATGNYDAYEAMQSLRNSIEDSKTRWTDLRNIACE